MARAWVARVALGAVVAGGLMTACAPSEPGEDPGTTVPEGWTTHAVGDVTLSAPPQWVAEESGDALVVRSGEDATAPLVSIALVAEPRPLQTEVDAVWASVLATLDAEKLDEGPVDKAGARQAARLEYVADQPDASGTDTFTTRTRWLFAVLEDGSGVMAAVSAPEDDFDDDVAAVLESVTLP